MNPSGSWLGALAHPWVWRTAWRDSRSSRKQLAVFSSSIVLGIAVLVAVRSLGVNLEQTIHEQAKSLLGADLVLNARHAFTEDEEKLFARMGGRQAREISFTSMLQFPGQERTRLVQVRAVEPGFPFYGELGTAPASARDNFHANGTLLVEESLLAQFHARPGDRVRLGHLETEVGGALQRVPGETLLFATLAPRVYLPMSRIEQTGLLRDESLARFKVYFQFDSSQEAQSVVRTFRTELQELRLNWETVQSRQRSLGRAMENLEQFLMLIGFVAVLLGGIGVASAIHVHVRSRLSTAALFRCLGAQASQAFSVYLLQGIVLGLGGALAGGALGLLIQWMLPLVLAGLLPFEVRFALSPSRLIEGIGLGFLFCFGFALLPLLEIRRAAPLSVLREQPPQGPDALRRLWFGGAALALIGFAWFQASSPREALGMAGGIAVVFGLLLLTARVLMFMARRFTPAAMPFACRHGISSLHRPHNRTTLLTLALGLGVFLALTISLTQHNLQNRLLAETSTEGGNTVLFDIQPGQLEGVMTLFEEENLPILQHAPVVTMRLSEVNGTPVRQLLTRRDLDMPRWVLRREYRSTYRSELDQAEVLVAGAWEPRAEHPERDVPISIEESIAGHLSVGLGDELVFDIQGVPIHTRIASIRAVEWRQVRPNFFVVFPSGVLEEAPGFHVLVTRVNSSEQSARLQNRMGERYPNVSTIDLSLVLETLDSILSKISVVIYFLTGFIAATGMLVLISVLLTGRHQRISDVALLRTLGASRKQVMQVLAVEYLSLGLLAAAAGTLLAVGASWLLAKYLFHTGFLLSFTPILVAWLAAGLTTLAVGLALSRGVTRPAPLVVLQGSL